MSKLPFPWIALGVGLLIALGLLLGGASAPSAEGGLPLLPLLLGAEFGFLLTGAGAVVAVRRMRREGVFAGVPLLLAVACAALSVGFLWLGLALWPGMSAAG